MAPDLLPHQDLAIFALGGGCCRSCCAATASLAASCACLVRGAPPASAGSNLVPSLCCAVPQHLGVPSHTPPHTHTPTLSHFSRFAAPLPRAASARPRVCHSSHALRTLSDSPELCAATAAHVAAPLTASELGPCHFPHSLACASPSPLSSSPTVSSALPFGPEIESASSCTFMPFSSYPHPRSHPHLTASPTLHPQLTSYPSPNPNPDPHPNPDPFLDPIPGPYPFHNPAAMSQADVSDQVRSRIPPTRSRSHACLHVPDKCG